MRSLYSLLFAGLLTSCTLMTPHIMEVQQGNAVEYEALKHVELGMNKDDIQRLLGAPLVKDIFHPHRLDYKFQLYKRHQLREDYLISFHFNSNGQLIKIDGRDEFLLKHAELNTEKMK